MYLSPEGAALAEESFSMYCKPLELYNILQHRASKHPLFLQRSLSYKIQAKRQRRIKMTVTFSGHVSDEVPGKNFWPLYVLLSSPIANCLEESSVYRLPRPCLLRTPTQQGCNEQSAVSFILPEIGKLSVDVDAHNLTILFVSCDHKTVSFGKASSMPQLVECTGQVLWGKVALGSLFSSWQKSPNLELGEKVDMACVVDLHSSNLEHGVLDDEKCIVFKTPSNFNGLNSVTRFQVIISAQEMGPRERSPYDSYSYNSIPSSSLLHIIRLRAGNVIFNYKYYNNRLQKTEVTEDFSCPFCLVPCASFKGLRLHLNSSHDLFNFEFWVTEDYQAVNVSLKNEIWRYEGNIPDVDGCDIRFKAYFFRSRSCPLKRWHLGVCNAISIHHQTEKHSPDSTMLGLSQMALSKKTAVTTLETSTETFPIGTMPSKEPSSASIVHSQSSDRIILEGRNRREKVQDGYLLQALPTKKANCQLDDAVEGVNNEESKKLETLASREIALSSERHQMESLVVDHARIADSLVTGIQGPALSGLSLSTTVPSTINECDPQTFTTNLAPPSMLRFEKTRRLSAERTESRNRALLQKRQFFHSHRAQSMALEQVLSDRDSEDEVDDDIADFEDRRMLDDFVDVTTHEKQLMHLWNSFVRKQRVLADGHIPWACEAFSKLHGRNLSQRKALLWCWRLFMVKLWNHNLLDAATMNRCNLILENCNNNQ
jgi:hypothetical protein